jgi:hypothetical protein
MSELIGPLHQKSLDEILARELRDTAKSIVQIKNSAARPLTSLSACRILIECAA